MDLMNSCRCCLRCPPDKDLTTPYTHLGKTDTYVDMLKECFDLHLTLGEDSSGICLECVDHLQNASKFKLQVQRSQAVLQAWLQGASQIRAELLGSEMADEDGANDGDMLQSEQGVNSDVSEAAMSDADCILVSDDRDDRVKEQFAITCSVGLDRLSDNASIDTTKTYGCDHCGKSFNTKFILRKHIQDSHLTTKPESSRDVDCVYCSSIFQTKFLAIEHENTGNGVTDVMLCLECDYATTSKNSLRDHIKSHIVANGIDSRNLFMCGKCDFTCSLSEDLTHQNIISNVESIKCNSCAYTCRNKSQLQKHQHIHEEKRFECSFCEYKSGSRSLFLTHLRKHTGEHHAGCSRDYTCDCSNRFKTHMTIHNGEKPYKCKHCHYKTSYYHTLQAHERSHTGEKPFACTYCNYRCDAKENLKTHLMRHTGEKRFKCSYCNFKCITRAGLTAHVMRHTGEKPYGCDICGHKCRQKRNLQSHMRIHNTAKPFNCTECNYSCKLRNQLRYHERVVHECEKRYQCGVCGDKFGTKQYLKLHEMTHIGEV